MPDFSSAALMAMPPRSTALKVFRAPESLPIGVRAPPVMTEPGMSNLLWRMRALLLLRQVQIGDGALERFGRQAHGFGQRGMRVDGGREVGGVGAHLHRVGDLGDEFPGVGPDDADAYDTPAGLVEQKLGQALVAAQRQGPAAG